MLVIFCPGCEQRHPIEIECPPGNPVGSGWTWNGSFEKPTFHPSLLCNKDHPSSRCHSFITDGKIRFLEDCWHKLKGQTVELPELEEY